MHTHNLRRDINGLQETITRAEMSLTPNIANLLAIVSLTNQKDGESPTH